MKKIIIINNFFVYIFNRKIFKLELNIRIDLIFAENQKKTKIK